MLPKNSREYKSRKKVLPNQQENLDLDWNEDFDLEVDLRSPQRNDYQTLEPTSQSAALISHAGKGPKNYDRPREIILDDANILLTRHHEIDATDIDIQVVKGDVFLTGSVPEEKMKRLAAEVIKTIPGVRTVTNHLQLRQT